MSIFGTIGYFLKEAWQGLADIIVGPLTSTRPDAAASAAANAAASKETAPNAPAPSALSEPSVREAPAAANAPQAEPIDGEPVLAPALDPDAASIAPRPTKAVAKSANRKRSSEPDGAEVPESPVAQRYRTLKAEGLAPKHANEFSRSAKKYALFRTLSTTRPHDGAATYWDALKDFDQKAAAHADMLKSSAAPKQKIDNFKTQTGRARDLLIQKYVNGKEALAEADAAFAHEIAETIGFEDF